MAMTLHFSVLTPGLAPPPLKSQLACKPELDVQVQPATAEMPTLSISSAPAFSLYSKPFLSLQSPPHQTKLFSLRFHPLRFQGNHAVVMKKNRRGFGAVCYSVPLAPQSLQFVCTISSAVLMLSKGTAVQKSFLVPFFALQAPTSIVSWIKGEYGTWTAFLALLVRLFFFIPGELELPFVALLLVIVAPYQVMNLRGTQVGAILSLLIAGYLAFQHFSRAGSLRKAFDQGSVVATLAIICITAVSCLLFI